MPRRISVGLDIGGTKIAAGCVDDTGAVLSAATAPTDPTVDGEGLFAVVESVVLSAIKGAEIATDRVKMIGVGCGGPMAAHGATVTPLNIPSWKDFPLGGRLAERFDVMVTVDNDAKALALGESRFGAGRGKRNFIAMVVSTGVGGGLIVDGRLVHGASDNAGHIGHVTVEPEGRRCVCGARGCLEAEASGTAIAAITGAPAAEASEAVRVRTGRLVGRGVAQVVNLLDIREAFVGGSVALGFGRPFFDAANEELAERSQMLFARGASIGPVGLGESGPVIGAACVGFAAADGGYWE